MTITSIQNSVNSAFSAVAALEETPLTLELLSQTRVAQGAYKVVLSHYNNRDYKEAEYQSAILAMFGGKVSLASNTVQRMGVGTNTQVSTFLTANCEVRSYTEEAVKGMTIVVANTFLDPSDDSIWTLKETAAGKQLVRSVNDDLDSLLSERLGLVTASVSFDDTTEGSTGDYVAYFHPETATTKFGFLAKTEAGYMVHSQGADDFEAVSSDCLMAHVTASDMSKNEASGFPPHTAASVSTEALKKYIAFQRKMFKGSDYFSKLNALITKQLGLGDTGLIMASDK